MNRMILPIGLVLCRLLSLSCPWSLQRWIDGSLQFLRPMLLVTVAWLGRTRSRPGVVRRCRQRLDGLVREYHGRVFGGSGDSLMVEFTSPVEGLRCAVEIQQQLAIAQEKLPEERRMRFRLGMNLGDAVIEDKTLNGEAVNVASRLEGSVRSWRICISGTLYEQVKHLPHWRLQVSVPANSENIQFPRASLRCGREPTCGARTPSVLRPGPRLPWSWLSAAAGASWMYFAVPLSNTEVGPRSGVHVAATIAILPLPT